MDRKVAEKIMEENLIIFSHLNSIMKEIECIHSEDEVREMRRNIGNVLAAMDINLFRPIVRHYPDLDPH